MTIQNENDNQGASSQADFVWPNRARFKKGGSVTTERKREQEDRKAYLENEKLLREKAAEDRRASTYLAMALADSELPGRFGKVTQQNIVGASAGPFYPQLPEGSSGAIPWPEDRNPLGFAIDAMEPVDPTAHSPAVDCAAVTLSAATVSLAVGEPIVTAALQSKSPPITGAAVGGDAGDSAANSVPRSSIRRL